MLNVIRCRKEFQAEMMRKATKMQKERARLEKERRQQAVVQAMDRKSDKSARPRSRMERRSRRQGQNKQKYMEDKAKKLRTKRKREVQKIQRARRKQEMEERERKLWHNSVVLENSLETLDSSAVPQSIYSKATYPRVHSTRRQDKPQRNEADGDEALNIVCYVRPKAKQSEHEAF